ncbi:hypothetical protein BIWAKO_07037 [Bosea sp. BIWAKO-01]|nr:hypothetical protein BIWAKO_07037 [Bosea sp. BIWAKO-01]
MQLNSLGPDERWARRCLDAGASRSYAKAQDDLKKKEALTFSEEELDNLLPPTLRRSDRKRLPPPTKT